MAVPEADPAPVTAGGAVLEGDDLVALGVVDDLGRDLGALDEGAADGDFVAADPMEPS